MKGVYLSACLLHDPGRQRSKRFFDDVYKDLTVGVLAEVGACAVTDKLRLQFLLRVTRQDEDRDVAFGLLQDLQKR